MNADRHNILRGLNEVGAERTSEFEVKNDDAVNALRVVIIHYKDSEMFDEFLDKIDECHQSRANIIESELAKKLFATYGEEAEDLVAYWTSEYALMRMSKLIEPEDTGLVFYDSMD